MRSLRAALVFLGAVGVAVGLAILTVFMTSDRAEHPALDAALVLTVGWSFIGTGLFAWWRRPLNRVGALMTAVGFAWFITPLMLSDIPGVFVFGVVFNNLAVVLLAYLILAFPSGRLESRFLRGIVIVGLFDAIGLQLIGMLFLRRATPEMNCDACPSNPIAITHEPSVFNAFSTTSAIGGVLLLAVMVVVLVRRRRTLSTASRSSITPVLLTGGLTLAVLGTSIAVQTASPHDVPNEAINLAAVICFALVPGAFLLGLLRTRITGAAAVGELVESLGEAGRHQRDIRDLLAEALGDPGLQFAYWLPDLGIYVDAEGAPLTLPSGNGDRAWTAIEHDGELVAAIVYDATLADQSRLVRSAGAAAALALKNQRLEAQLRANLAELRASRARIVEASDETRRRLERNLHDGAQQHLVSLAINLRLARGQLDKDPAKAAELIDQAAEELSVATGELRELARGIHPAILSDRGLVAAVNALASRSTVPVRVTATTEQRLPGPVEAAAYYVVAEALTNVARYAGAGVATVDIELAGGVLTVTVGDDGDGGADPAGGSGLRGLRDRVAALDGSLTVESTSGVGTTIRAEIPCAS